MRAGFLLVAGPFVALCSLAQSPSQAGAAAGPLQISNHNRYLGLPLAF